MEFVLGTKKAYGQNFLLTKTNRIENLFFRGKNLLFFYLIMEKNLLLGIINNASTKKEAHQKNGPSLEETIKSLRTENNKLPRVATRKSLVYKMTTPMSCSASAPSNPWQKKQNMFCNPFVRSRISYTARVRCYL